LPRNRKKNETISLSYDVNDHVLFTPNFVVRQKPKSISV